MLFHTYDMPGRIVPVQKPGSVVGGEAVDAIGPQ